MGFVCHNTMWQHRLSQLVHVTIQSYTMLQLLYINLILYQTKSLVMSKQTNELSLVKKIKNLLSMTILHCVIENSNTH